MTRKRPSPFSLLCGRTSTPICQSRALSITAASLEPSQGKRRTFPGKRVGKTAGFAKRGGFPMRRKARRNFLRDGTPGRKKPGRLLQVPRRAGPWLENQTSGFPRFPQKAGGKKIILTDGRPPPRLSRSRRRKARGRILGVPAHPAGARKERRYSPPGQTRPESIPNPAQAVPLPERSALSLRTWRACVSL